MGLKSSKTNSTRFPIPRTLLEGSLVKANLYTKLVEVLVKNIEGYEGSRYQNESGYFKILQDSRKLTDVAMFSFSHKMNLERVKEQMISNVSLKKLNLMLDYFKESGAHGQLFPGDLASSFYNETNSLATSLVFSIPFHIMITQRYQSLNAYEFLLAVERVCLMSLDDIFACFFGLIYIVSQSGYPKLLKKLGPFKRSVYEWAPRKQQFHMDSILQILCSKDSDSFEPFFRNYSGMLVDVERFAQNFSSWKDQMESDCLQDDKLVVDLQHRFQGVAMSFDDFKRYVQSSSTTQFMAETMLKLWRKKFGGRRYWKNLRAKLMNDKEESFLLSFPPPRLECFQTTESVKLLGVLQSSSKRISGDGAPKKIMSVQGNRFGGGAPSRRSSAGPSTPKANRRRDSKLQSRRMSATTSPKVKGGRHGSRVQPVSGRRIASGVSNASQSTISASHLSLNVEDDDMIKAFPDLNHKLPSPAAGPRGKGRRYSAHVFRSLHTLTDTSSHVTGSAFGGRRSSVSTTNAASRGSKFKF